MADYQQKLANILKNYFPDSLINKAQQGVNRVESSKKLGASLSEFPGGKYGYNLTEAPDMYLGYAPPNKVMLDKYNDKTIGGETINNLFADKIKINPNSVLDPLYTLVHEAQHRRDFTDKYKNYNPNDKAFLKTQEQVVKNFYDSGKDNSADPIERESVSGQMAPNEIVAQLKSYESMLPAGMNIFQSPLGKQIFKDDATKQWWLQRTTTKLSDL